MTLYSSYLNFCLKAYPQGCVYFYMDIIHQSEFYEIQFITSYLKSIES